MSDIIKTEPKFEKFARFQALQAGHYWRALVDVPDEAIDKDEVLLIESIRWVDNSAHTIIMRAHPSKHGKYVQREITRDDGSKTKRNVSCGQHRFLLKDFLDSFEFEPDHQQIRTREVQAIHGRINELQHELVEGQANPEILAQITHDGLQKHQADSMRKAGATAEEIAAAPARDAGVSGQMMMIAGGTVADALGTGITVEGIAALRESVDRQSQIATIKAAWITEKTNQIAETVHALTPFYKEQAAAALANTEDVRKQVDQLLLGIESLDLYVGKDVFVNTICTGASADPEEPLTFVQRKLMMDEELAIWADLDEWFDFTNKELFYKALQEHESLVDQIFPTERCILVMATTRRDIDYGHPAANAELNAKNRTVFLMVRDGENVHQVYSSVESHLSASRLFPSKDDQDRVFAGVDGTSIKFDDVAYTDKLAAHERYALHYKRFLLLVCGLDHRLKLFGDFYKGPPTLHFVSMQFQEERCRFLHDDDGFGLLPSERRPALDGWIAEKNEYLRSGSRVLCNWGELMNPDTAPGACKPDRMRDGFEQPYRPKNTMDVAIAFRDGESICVNVQVSGYSWSKSKDREFKCKVNLSELRRGSWRSVDLPFLCIDAVSPEELHWYIQNRETRRNHISYIRFFKRALQHLLVEREHERDTRQRMAQALQDGSIACGNEADGIIQQAVIAWRAANRGKDLPAFEGTRPPAAWKALLDQMYLLAGEGQRQASAVQAFVEQQGLQPLRLVLSGSAKLMVYAAPDETELDERLAAHIWVHCIQLDMEASGYREKSRKWALLPKAAASETTLHEWPESSLWVGKTVPFASYEQKQEIFTYPAKALEQLDAFIHPMGQQSFVKAFHGWMEARDDATALSKYIESPSIAFPIGVVRFRNEVRYLCVAADAPVAIIHRLAPDDAARTRLRREFCRLYKHKDKADRQYDAALAESRTWSLKEISVDLRSTYQAPYVHGKFGTWVNSADGFKHSDPLLNNWLDRYMSESKKSNGQLWLAEWVLDDHGRPVLDEMLGIKLPEEYRPLSVRAVTIREADDTEQVPQVTKWFDIFPEGVDEASVKIDRPFKSCSTHSHTALTLAEAHAYIQSHSSSGIGYKLLVSAPSEPYPVPASVIERWVEIKGSDKAAQ